MPPKCFKNNKQIISKEAFLLRYYSLEPESYPLKEEPIQNMITIVIFFFGIYYFSPLSSL